MTLVLNVTNLKYGKYDMTGKKKNNNKRLMDRAKKQVTMKKVTQKFKNLKISENITTTGLGALFLLYHLLFRSPITDRV